LVGAKTERGVRRDETDTILTQNLKLGLSEYAETKHFENSHTLIIGYKYETIEELEISNRIEVIRW